MKVINLVICFIAILSISCATRQGGTTAPVTQQPAASCAGTTGADGICYPGTDADADGASSSYEVAHGTNPNDPDSDDDTFNDFCEILKGTDPNSATSKPADCKFESAPAPDLSGIDQALKSLCVLHDAQKKQEEWINNHLEYNKDKNSCPEDNGKSGCQDAPLNSSSSEGTKAINYGLDEEAELASLEITVKWGVSYRDVLMISNGVMTIKPWFTFFRYRWEDKQFDDRQWDHHLGDLPSTAPDCPQEIRNIAEVQIGGGAWTEWLHPAFLPFKIDGAENIYPFSTDGVSGSYNASDKIVLLGGPLNNFNFPMHLISVQVINDHQGPGDGDSEGDLDAGNCIGKCKYYNNMCETREVKFTYQYYKTKTDDSLSYDYTDLENQCKAVLSAK